MWCLCNSYYCSGLPLLPREFVAGNNVCVVRLRLTKEEAMDEDEYCADCAEPIDSLLWGGLCERCFDLTLEQV